MFWPRNAQKLLDFLGRPRNALGVPGLASEEVETVLSVKPTESIT